MDWFGRSDRSKLLALLSSWRAGLLTQVADGTLATTNALDVISEDMTHFNGFGKHTAMDLLHELRILPHMPVSQLVSDDALFQRLECGILQFVDRFGSDFLRKCAGETNTTNPFEFNEGSNTHYISSYVCVYRRRRVRISTELYNTYMLDGLLDPNHVIGAFAA